MKIGERAKARRLELGLTQAEVAIKSGTAQQNIQQLEDGRINRPRYLPELAKALNCDHEWLISGKGSPPAHDDKLSPENHWGMGESWDRHTPVFDDEVEVPYLKDIDLACGDGCCVEEDYNGLTLRFPKEILRKVNAQKGSVLCFPAFGNSMEPLIPEGSIVAINILDKKIVDGKVYAINQDGWKRLKILYRIAPNRLSIRSFNSEEYAPEEADLDSVEIIGRMFWTSTIW